MDQQSQQLKHNVMRRVEHEYFMRTVVRPFLIECSLLAGVIGGATFFVSIRNVVNNVYANHSLGDIVRYGWSAFTQTELSVQVLAVAGLVLAGLVIRDVLLGLAHTAVRIRSAFA